MIAKGEPRKQVVSHGVIPGIVLCCFFFLFRHGLFLIRMLLEVNSYERYLATLN